MKVLQVAMLFVFLRANSCESQSPNTETLIQKYEQNVNKSKILQRDDKRILNTWTDEYQVKRLDVSVKYRIQMMKHEEHSFKTDGNVKWMECLHVHRKDIKKSKSFYHENELECLRSSTTRDAEKKYEIELLEKQFCKCIVECNKLSYSIYKEKAAIAKWRKGYRYLVNLCDSENPGNEEGAQECLVEYMQNDRYDEVVERLMILKQSAMEELYKYYQASLMELDECLNTQLSNYLELIRKIMVTLNKCYSITA